MLLPPPSSHRPPSGHLATHGAGTLAVPVEVPVEVEVELEPDKTTLQHLVPSNNVLLNLIVVKAMRLKLGG